MRSGEADDERRRAQADPLRRTGAAIRDVLAGKRGGLRSALLFVGPAMIASIAYIDPGNFATNIGIVGPTVLPHAIYLHSGLTHNRAPGADARERRILLRFSNREYIVALTLAGVVKMAMVMMASAAFHTGHTDVSEIQTAYRTLTPLLGVGAAAVFLLSPMASGISNSVVGTMARQMIMQGFVGFRIPMGATPDHDAAGLRGGGPRRGRHRCPRHQQVALSLALPVPMLFLVLFTRSQAIVGEFASTALTQRRCARGHGRGPRPQRRAAAADVRRADSRLAVTAGQSVMRSRLSRDAWTRLKRGAQGIPYRIVSRGQP